RLNWWSTRPEDDRATSPDGRPRRTSAEFRRFEISIRCARKLVDRRRRRSLTLPFEKLLGEEFVAQHRCEVVGEHLADLLNLSRGVSAVLRRCIAQGRKP